MHKFVLASASPRRQELIKFLNIDFIVHPSDAEEVINNDLNFEEVVMEIASAKAKDISHLYEDKYTLGFDTLVIHNEKALGKPKNDEEAFNMLRDLSGETHRVLTGVCITKGDFIKTIYGQADVTFNELTDQEIIDYIKTKDPMDKAGSYGIQDHGAKFIQKIDGDFYTVMGLPIAQLYNEIKNLK